MPTSSNFLTRSMAYKRAMEAWTIRDEHSRLVPMKFSESQNIMWRYVAPRLDSHERLWFIVLKSRQVYATTFFENLIFTRTIEKPNTQSLIIAQDLDTSQAIFEMAKRFYDHLPLPKLKPSKVKELVFPMRGGPSRFKVVSAGTAAKGRGTTQTCVHCSEIAFWPHPEVFSGLFQAMPDLGDTMWIIESTANGLIGTGQPFYEQWKAAISGRSKLIPIFIPWFVMQKYREAPELPPDEWDEEEKLLVETFGDLGLDGYSLRWRRNVIDTKLGGLVEMFHQEYPATDEEAFISKGLPAFDQLAILKQAKNKRPPRYRMTLSGDTFVKDKDGELFLWEEPKEGHQYAIGVDTAEGVKGGDFACAQVIDMDDLEQVAVVHGLLQPWDFSKLLDRLGRKYNTAIVNIEVKNTGWAVQDYMLRIFQYPRFHPWKGKPDRVNVTSPRLWGWDTNTYSRPLLIEAGRRAINKNLLTIHDGATLQEIKQFTRQDDGCYEAEAGHDDRVLALLLALRTREENYTPVRSSWKNIEFSEPDFRGVRVVDASEPEKLALRHIHKALQEKARKAVSDWMKL